VLLSKGEQPTKFAFWTVESTTNLRRPGPKDTDFLGLNVRVAELQTGNVEYICLREGTLWGRPLYFEAAAKVSSDFSKL